MHLQWFRLGAVALLGLPLVAHADTIYQFTLTSTQGYAGGSGSFALNVQPPDVGTVAYSFSGGPPYTVGYQIDAFTETYTPPPGGYAATSREFPLNLSYIQFTDGVLSAFSAFDFFGGTPSCQPTLAIGLTSYSYSEVCFLYSDFPQFYNDAGTVTITPATAAAVTPEPPEWVLLGTGMLAMLGVVRRRMGGVERGGGVSSSNM